MSMLHFAAAMLLAVIAIILQGCGGGHGGGSTPTPSPATQCIEVGISKCTEWDVLNGEYDVDGQIDGFNSYRLGDSEYTITHSKGNWIIDNQHAAFDKCCCYYSVVSSASTPPSQGWGTHGCQHSDAPPPSVTCDKIGPVPTPAPSTPCSQIDMETTDSQWEGILNGHYMVDGQIDGFNSYRKGDEEYTITHSKGNWIIDSQHGGFDKCCCYYSVVSSASAPPSHGWGTAGCQHPDATPPTLTCDKETQQLDDAGLAGNITV